MKAAKEAAPELLVITDVCFCEYTDHGHCGVIDDHTGRMDVNNDATLELLGKQAVSHAQAGADLVAPSGMMDGMVGAIRGALDGGRLHARADPELRRQIRQRLLRTVSRSGRKHAASSATAAPIRWTLPPPPSRRCARSSSTWPKGPT